MDFDNSKRIIDGTFTTTTATIAFKVWKDNPLTPEELHNITHDLLKVLEKHNLQYKML